MSKKQRLTNAEIEKDIIHALKNPPHTPASSYKKTTLPAILAACVLVVMEFIYPLFVLWAFLALLVLVIGGIIFGHYRLKNQIKKVSINDYDITTEVVHSIAEEHYRAERGGGRRHRRRTEQIDNYSIRFESGKIWRVPQENYAWSERLRSSDLGVYNSTHREDSMIVVTKRASGDVVMAYHADIFEYKN